jgi:Bacterial surface protein, Ig-like domain/HYR domain/NHL repeat
MKRAQHFQSVAMALLFGLSVLLPGISQAMETIDTIAGGGPNTVPGVTVGLNFPRGITVDSAGNQYIADQVDNKVFKLDSSGIITTVAGIGSQSFCGDGGPATTACLNQPIGVAVDGAGNLYITEIGNNRVRKVAAGTGVITTIAGNGSLNFCGDGGLATAACLAQPSGVAVDGSGNLFIAEFGNRRVRKVTASTGVISTVAGNGSASFCGDGGLAVNACLNLPNGIAVDVAGNLFIADQLNNRIRRVEASTGVITTVAGNGSASFCGDGGLAVNACLNSPRRVAVEGTGNLFIADGNNFRVRMVANSTGVITTVVGNGTASVCGDGGLATDACARPEDVAVNGVGDLFTVSTQTKRVRQVLASTGVITTIAGDGTRSFCGDGFLATGACLQRITKVAVDGAGNVFIPDNFNHRIRKVEAGTGIITTVAGNGMASFCGDGGLAVDACLNLPVSVAIGPAGNLFIADQRNRRIRKITVSTGIITTVGGNGTTNNCPGPNAIATNTCIPEPADVAVGPGGDVLIADPRFNRVRRIVQSTGRIHLVAGNGLFGFLGDGGLAVNARLNRPLGVAVGPGGDVFIADTNNHRIRRVRPSTGGIITVAGSSSFGGYFGDGGPATSARLNTPAGVFKDGSGNLYIADQRNNLIRKVEDSTGLITRVAGNGLFSFCGDGGPPLNACFAGPQGVSVDTAGNLFIADTNNNRIRKVTVGVAADTVPPVMTVPLPITVEAVDALGTPDTEGTIQAFLNGATAIDAVDGPLTPTNDAPANFPFGLTTVNFSATDAAGNTGSISSTVTIEDSTAPLLIVPANFSVEATSASGAVVNYIVTATDAVDTSPTINCAQATGMTFALGSHTVSCTAQDFSGNIGNASFDVSVVDTTAPTLTVPSEITEEATGPSGANVSFTVTAIDLVDPAPTVSCTANSGDVFPLGTTMVDCTATDSSTNGSMASFQIIVEDTTVPVLTVPTPGSIVLEATSGSGAVANFNVTATDIADPAPVVNCVASSGSTFGLGTTTVNCTATDASANVGNASFEVVVQDTTVPVLTVPATLQLEATSGSGAIGTFNVTATDTVDATPVVACVAPSGSTFVLGTTTVNCTATDASANVGNASFEVVVQDTTVPVLTVPATLQLEATSGSGAIGTFNVTATDTVDATPVVACVAPSGSTFGLGTTTVNCTATDASANVGNASFEVVVQDTTAPVLTVPATLQLEATSGSGTIGTFNVTATDTVDATPVVACVAPSGSTFGLGRTTVNCTATDASANVGNASFEVVVQDTTVPVILLVGPTPQVLEGGTPYSELGATGSDVVDGDVTLDIVIDASAVNPAVPGGYLVTYNVSDDAGNAAAQVTRTVNVVDTTPPTILLVGATPQVLEGGTAYGELGATASDSVDGDVSGNIVIDASAVNTAVSGSYLVTYNVSDNAGNAATQVTRTVDVVDTTPPVVTPPASIIVAAVDNLTGTPSSEATIAAFLNGGSASDIVDGPVGAIVTGVPAFYPVGVSTVTFRATDAAGNEGTATATITVNGRPVFTAPNASQSVAEGTTLNFVVTANDPEFDSLTFFPATGLPPGASFTPNTGAFSYTPDFDVSTAASNTTFTVGLMVSDGLSLVSFSVDIEVQDVNRPPTVESMVQQLTDIGTTAFVRLDSLGSDDPEDDPSALNYRWTVDAVVACDGNQVICGAIDIPLDYGVHTVTVRVTDLGGLFAEDTKQVTINPALLAVFDTGKTQVHFGGDSPHVKVDGEIGLPFGVDSSELTAQATVSLDLAGLNLVTVPSATPVLFEIKGKKNEHWEFDEKSIPFGLTKFKIDWKGASFNFKDHGFPVEFKSQLITTSETVLAVKLKEKDIDTAFTLDIDGQALMTFDADSLVTSCVIGLDLCTAEQLEVKKPGKELILTLPFPLLDSSEIRLSGGVATVIVVGDTLKESVGRFKLEAKFDGALFPNEETTLPRTLDLAVSVGAEEYPGFRSLGPIELKVKGDKWEAK